MIVDSLFFIRNNLGWALPNPQVEIVKMEQVLILYRDKFRSIWKEVIWNGMVKNEKECLKIQMTRSHNL